MQLDETSIGKQVDGQMGQFPSERAWEIRTSHYFSDFRRAQAQKRNHGDALAVRG